MFSSVMEHCVATASAKTTTKPLDEARRAVASWSSSLFWILMVMSNCLTVTCHHHCVDVKETSISVFFRVPLMLINNECEHCAKWKMTNDWLLTKNLKAKIQNCLNGYQIHYCPARENPAFTPLFSLSIQSIPNDNQLGPDLGLGLCQSETEI